MTFDVAASEFFRAQIFSELFSRPLLWASVAAGARRFHHDRVTWMQNQACQLPRQIFDRAIGAEKHEDPGFSGFATENARRASTKSLAGTGKFTDMSHWSNNAAQSKSSPPAPCSSGIHDQRILLHAQRIFHFDRFDGQV